MGFEEASYAKAKIEISYSFYHCLHFMLLPHYNMFLIRVAGEKAVRYLAIIIIA